MTNVEIIRQKSMELMKEGILGTTGNMIEVAIIDENGEEKTMAVPEPEAIHTYATWKKLGYQVNKGEHAIAQFTIWKHVTKKNEDEEEESKMFMKKASWFKASQVAPIEAQ